MNPKPQMSESNLEKSYDLIIKLKKSLFIKNSEDLMDLPLNLLIKYCGAIITPNEAGFKIAKYIVQKCKMEEVLQGVKRGDCSFYHDGIRFAEIKVSFLSQRSSMYTVRNIRPWHNIDYYLLCFIPDFNSDPLFYVVKLKDLLYKFHPSFMAGTWDENLENKKSCVGITIPCTTENIGYLEKINLLNGSSFDDLYDFNDLTKRVEVSTFVHNLPMAA